MIAPSPTSQTMTLTISEASTCTWVKEMIRSSVLMPKNTAETILAQLRR
jgi:hypothetical protein